MPVDVLADRYVLETPIAQGGMATVWRARDEVLARTVTVKILQSHLSQDPAFLERFRREALAAARLAHPNIVAIYDTGDHASPGETSHYIVMEYCSGGTLADLLAASGPLDADHAAAIGAAVCDALHHAHSQGVVHRDVKPGNVLLTSDGTIKVSDFGIARAAESGDVTTTGTILGTVAYISPEQAKDREPDARSDLYSLGVVLYELLVGRPPFHEETHVATAIKHVNAAPPTPRSLRGAIPRSLEAVVMRALEKDPDRRFPTAADMRAALAEAAGGRDTAVVPRVRRALPAEPAGDEPSPGRSLVPIAALVAAAVVAAIALGALFGPNGERSGRGVSGDGGGDGQPGGIRVVRVASFDPDGDGSEHEIAAPSAADGDDGTAWTTESYDDPLAAQGKEGVGLLFDLGADHAVARVAVTGDPGAFTLLYDDELGDELGDFEATGEKGDGADTIELESPATARYWVLWITELPAGIGNATVTEVTFFGVG